ncbi:UTP--glucose-1-phosphate uridylyltransferase [Saguinus oedipus]|uniref:UTP--glucose-1-phosphate uridylyltransferase n=1 Tax=Saguinus oedipus TaxID=9490 RepID=A0ABQ9U677_SAGOE|nr:UTP--glucose-1-phosphate uridylyltransferase [Saguinus oedipus]
MSQDGASQFQEVIRQELELSVKKELEKILTTASSHEFEHTKKDLDGFRKLFHRFLQEKGPSVDWGKIQRPPEDSQYPVSLDMKRLFCKVPSIPVINA